MYTFFLFVCFEADNFVVVQFTQKPSYFSKSLEHICDHEGNLTWMLKIAFVVFITTRKLQFTLENVSSRPSHLSNSEII